MQLVVRPGREYLLGGRMYKGGETVDAPDKFVKILTAPKGPLEHPTQRRPATTDLPPEVMNRAAVQSEPPAPAEARPPYPEPETQAPSSARRRDRYSRRDLTAEE